MAFRKVLSLLIMIHVCSVLSQSDPDCRTPTNKTGSCVPIVRCRNINTIVNSPTQPPRPLRNYIKHAGCNLPGVTRSICCQPREVVPRRPLLPEDCGNAIFSKISRGNTTEPFEYPWVVVLRYEKDGEFQDQCGGSLINNRYVLTAAHCVRTSNGFNLISVRLGEQDKSKPIDCIVYSNGEKRCADPPLVVGIESTVVHQGYSVPEYTHDIALIRMAREVTYSDSIKPICLPLAKELRNLIPPRFFVAGWGMTEKRSPSHVLMQAIIDPVPSSDCKQIFKNIFKYDFSGEHQICAGGKNRVDTCNGDSGGPLGFPMEQAEARMVQYGIVSAGIKSCGDWSVPGLYTNVSSHMDWIVQNMHP